MSGGVRQRSQTRWWWVRHAPVTHLSEFIYGDSDPEAEWQETVSKANALRAAARDAHRFGGVN